MTDIPPRHGTSGHPVSRKWSGLEITRLKAMHREGKTLEAIASALGRSKGAVSIKLHDTIPGSRKPLVLPRAFGGAVREAAPAGAGRKWLEKLLTLNRRRLADCAYARGAWAGYEQNSIEQIEEYNMLTGCISAIRAKLEPRAEES